MSQRMGQQGLTVVEDGPHEDEVPVLEIGQRVCMPHVNVNHALGQ